MSFGGESRRKPMPPSMPVEQTESESHSLAFKLFDAASVLAEFGVVPLNAAEKKQDHPNTVIALEGKDAASVPTAENEVFFVDLSDSGGSARSASPEPIISLRSTPTISLRGREVGAELKSYAETSHPPKVSTATGDLYAQPAPTLRIARQRPTISVSPDFKPLSGSPVSVASIGVRNGLGMDFETDRFAYAAPLRVTVSDTPMSALTGVTGFDKTGLDFSQLAAFDESKTQSVLEHDFARLDVSRSTCAASKIGQMISEVDASSHAVFLASMAQGVNEPSRTSMEDAASISGASPEREVHLPPNSVAHSLCDNGKANDSSEYKEAVLIRKIRRETIIAYEASDPECTGLLGRPEFDVFMDAMGFNPLHVAKASQQIPHSINERSFLIASELSRMSIDIKVNPSANSSPRGRSRSPRSQTSRKSPANSNSRPVSPYFAADSEDFGRAGNRTPFSDVNSVSRDVSNSAAEALNPDTRANTKRKPGRMTIMESMVPDLFRPKSSSNSPSASRGTSPGLGTDMDDASLRSSTSQKRGTSAKRGSFFGLYSRGKAPQETQAASRGVSEARGSTVSNQEDSRSISTSIKLDHKTSPTHNLLSNGVTMEGAAWFVQIVYGIDYFEDSKIAAVVRDINSHMLMYKRGKATNKYLAANEAAAKEAADRELSGNHRFKGTGRVFNPKQHCSFYGTYDDHESQTSGLTTRHREHQDQIKSSESERFKAICTFSPKVELPPQAGVGDAVEVNISEILRPKGSTAVLPSAQKGEDPWQEAVIVDIEKSPAPANANSAQNVDVSLVSIRLPGSPDVHKVPQKAIRPRWTRRKIMQDLEGHSTTGVTMSKTISFRRADPRTSEQRMLEDHCTFKPASHVDKAISGSLMKMREQTMRGGRMGAMYSNTTGLVPGPPARTGVPLFYYDAKAPPDFSKHIYMQMVQVVQVIPVHVEPPPAPPVVETPVVQPAVDFAVRASELSTVPLAPALPRWTWTAGGDPANRQSKGSSASASNSVKKTPAPAKKGVMESVLEELQKKFANQGSSALGAILNKTDSKSVGKLSNTGTGKKKRRGAKVFTEVMDELAYTLAKMRGEVKDEEFGKDDDESEEELPPPVVKRPSISTPAVKKWGGAATPSATPAPMPVPNSLASVFGVIEDAEGNAENKDKFACIPLAKNIVAPPRLPLAWPPVPHFGAPDIKSVLGTGVRRNSVPADNASKPTSDTSSSTNSVSDNRIQSGSEHVDAKSVPAVTVETVVKNSSAISTEKSAAAGTQVMVMAASPRPLPSGYYMEAPEAVVVTAAGITSGGSVGSGLMGTLQVQWKQLKKEVKTSTEGVVMPQSFYEGVERLRMAAKLREEERERKRSCEMRTYPQAADVEAKSTGQTLAPTVPKEFHFPYEDRLESKRNTHRKSLATSSASKVSEHPTVEPHDHVAVHGAMRQHMRRQSAYFVDTLRSSVPTFTTPGRSQSKTKEKKESGSMSTTPTEGSPPSPDHTCTTDQTASTKKDLFDHIGAPLPASQRRAERKLRAEQAEKEKQKAEKLAKEKMRRRAQSTYQAPVHQHPHEKILLNYSAERPELVKETLRAHLQYSVSNRLIDINPEHLQQPKFNVMASKSVVQPALVKTPNPQVKLFSGSTNPNELKRMQSSDSFSGMSAVRTSANW